MTIVAGLLVLLGAIAAPQAPSRAPEAASPPAAPAATTPEAEAHVVDYLRTHVRPGEPVVASELYNSVFKTPAERAALDRLFNAFFKVPLFLAQHQKATGRPPTLAEIAEQFAFRVPGEADVLLRVMEADPRVPRFFERDPASGEITRIDVAAIRADPRFGKPVERTLAGLEGRPAPAFTAPTPDGTAVGAASLSGKPHLLYFWFSGCPPCVRTAPLLAELQRRYAGRGLAIVALNADRVLEVPATDAERAAYARKNGWAFPIAEARPETIEAYGAVSVFPTFFFVDRHGTVTRQLVGFQDLATLSTAAERALE